MRLYYFNYEHNLQVTPLILSLSLEIERIFIDTEHVQAKNPTERFLAERIFPSSFTLSWD